MLRIIRRGIGRRPAKDDAFVLDLSLETLIRNYDRLAERHPSYPKNSREYHESTDRLSRESFDMIYRRWPEIEGDLLHLGTPASETYAFGKDLGDWLHERSEVALHSPISDDHHIDDECRKQLLQWEDHLPQRTEDLIRRAREFDQRLTPPTASPANDLPRIGDVDEAGMRVFTAKGWSDLTPVQLEAVMNLTAKPGAWLKNWQCFGADPHTNKRVDKLGFTQEVLRHIDSNKTKGYRWSAVPTNRRPKMKSKRSPKGKKIVRR